MNAAYFMIQTQLTEQLSAPLHYQPYQGFQRRSANLVGPLEVPLEFDGHGTQSIEVTVIREHLSRQRQAKRSGGGLD